LGTARAANALRPRAIQQLSDNAPQYTATASVLYAHELGLVPITTPAYSPIELSSLVLNVLSGRTLPSGGLHRHPPSRGRTGPSSAFTTSAETAEQWIKEGKAATHWTRLSCHRFEANQVQLLLGVIAYNLGNLL